MKVTRLIERCWSIVAKRPVIGFVVFNFFLCFSSFVVAVETRSVCDQTAASNLYSGTYPSWFDGSALIYGRDGLGNTVFLGRITSNEFLSDSILNSYGTNGSAYSTNSIFNIYVTWGSPYSSYGACNSYASSSSVPYIVWNNQLVGYLTTNSYVTSYVNPVTLVSALLAKANASASVSDVQAPSVPTGLTATATSSTQINLSWTASTDNVGVTGYKVYSNGISLGTTSTNTPSTSITGNTPSTTYVFTVSACDAAGNCSAQSTSASAMTIAAPIAVLAASTSASATSGVAPLTVSFTGTGTSTVTTDFLTYSWKFGDGTTSTARNPSHTYSTPGTYIVALIVSNTTGQTATSTARTITVAADTSPDAFSFTPVTGAAINSAVTSAPILANGFNTAIRISISGGQYSLDNGNFTSVSGTIQPLQTMRVRVTTGSAYNQTSIATLTLGGITGTFSVTTRSNPNDCLFDWAERIYPQFFAPAGAPSSTYPPYYYRYYSGTFNYLAVSSADNHIWVLGPISGNNLLDVAPVATFLNTAGCQ